LAFFAGFIGSFFADFFETDFLAGAFFAGPFFAGPFLAGAFLAGAFFAAFFVGVDAAAFFTTFFTASVAGDFIKASAAEPIAVLTVPATSSAIARPYPTFSAAFSTNVLLAIFGPPCHHVRTQLQIVEGYAEVWRRKACIAKPSSTIGP
jgi:hypothetical protein